MFLPYVNKKQTKKENKIWEEWENQSYHRVSGGLMTSVNGFGWQRLPQMFMFTHTRK